MCDTLIKKEKNYFIFGKNSDRSCNEPNLVLFIPAKNQIEKEVQLTYITIPQQEKTAAMILVKPSWTWGAEMGINEYGVCIGNEAIFTRSKSKKTPSIIGMDYVRLGLERAKTSKDAVDVIVTLLETYGQGGNCGFDKAFYYDNSYLICDKDKAFILETVDKKWLIKEVSDNGNISNCLQIQNGFGSTDKTNFLQDSEPIFTFFLKAKKRQKQANIQLQSGQFNLETMIKTLRSHQLKTKNLFTKGSVESICMHQSLLGDHTTGSMIIEGRANKPNTIWITKGSTPCLSLYLPYFFDSSAVTLPNDAQIAISNWLDHEFLVRSIMVGLIDKQNYQEKINAIQDKWVKREQDIFKNNPNNQELLAFSQICEKEEKELYDSYHNEIERFKNGCWNKPTIWKKKTAKLGINVTSINYRTRYQSFKKS